VTLRSGRYPRRDELDERTTLYVDLTEEGSMRPYADALPPGVRHVRMPIPDFEIPSKEEMVAILDTIDAALADGQHVYVHCRAGIGRTRTVIGCHRRRHGLDPGPLPETDEQQAMVQGWPEGR
jgi:polymorphic toxin system DSP-PTPase phosphatase-like protein